MSDQPFTGYDWPGQDVFTTTKASLFLGEEHHHCH
jgi:hypothetical protein